jgi:hypothetical protein
MVNTKHYKGMVFIMERYKKLFKSVNLENKSEKQLELEKALSVAEKAMEDFNAKADNLTYGEYKKQVVPLEKALSVAEKALSEYKTANPVKKMQAGDFCMYALMQAETMPENGSELGNMALKYTTATTANGIQMTARGTLSTISYLKTYDELKAEIIAEYEAEKQAEKKNK